MDPLILGAAGGLVQSVGNIWTAKKNRQFQERENQKQRDWSNEMFDKQNKRDLDFWNMQNAYNDPLAQMQRLSNAGLNPHLVYGNGADSSAGPIATHSAPQPNTRAPELPPLGDAIAGGLFSFLDVQQKKANVARTEAETKAITANTANREFLNGLNNTSYLQMLRQDMANKVNKGHYGSELERIQYESLSQIFDNDNELWLKAQRAGLTRTIQEIELAQKVGDKMSAETALKQFELKLLKQGINRSDNAFFRLINATWNNVFGQPITDGMPTPKTVKDSFNKPFKNLKNPFK